MRLGGQIFRKYTNAREWAEAVKSAGYTAVYCPVTVASDSAERLDYRRTAEKEDIVIAEVGAWSNPIGNNADESRKAMALCKESLALAEEIGALCCVNIAGSKSTQWDGPHPDNLSKDTFAQVVDTVREIIDAVKPAKVSYTLEPMPWIFPDSAESYLELIKAIDRKQFAVHFDPVNLINCPSKYFDNAGFIKDFVEKLGPYIISCHAKDILIEDHLTVHLNERRPGLGTLDYQTYLKEIAKLPGDIPIMLEHLPEESDYVKAAEYVRDQAAKAGIRLG